MQLISDIDDDRISMFRSLREHQSDARSAEGLAQHPSIVIAESERVVLKALKTPVETVAVLCSQRQYEKHHDLLMRSLPDSNRLFVATEELMQQIVGYKLHQNILLAIHQPSYTPLESMEYPMIALNGLQDSENVGAIIRSARAFGFRSVLMDDRCCSVWLRRAVRVSVGAVLSMQVHRCSYLPSTLEDLRIQYSAHILVAELCKDSIDIRRLSIPSRPVLVVGSEGYGVESDVLAQAHHIVHFPISDQVDSLNVAVAASLLCAQISTV